MKVNSRKFGVFFWVAGLWWALSAAWVSNAGSSLSWLSAIWFLCMADLFALAKLVSALLELVGSENEDRKKHGQAVIRASSWGAIKLACLAFIGMVLFRGRDIPTYSLLAGLGTLVVVPIFGGLGWHLRGERHA